ncbi:related to GTP-binding protein rab2 [Cephalotrichum gorgonifer]|uniref:Related to GTP-binding protein rab2 n=1 Tax=Cephalotrichum gorgonifer TaxID=2041049 RepID=A0AAE8SWH9_9PEZI|nr:related to GTP-binding protein rab2 [Cephalotrichum gorgonifer]
MSSSPPWDYIAKLVCIGDSGCGKSSLTIRLCEGRFSPHHDVTIGVEFGSRIVPVGPPHAPQPSSLGLLSSSTPSAAAPAPPKNDSKNGLPEPPRAPSPPQEQYKGPQKHMKLSLWDTAGQETYKSVTRSYFRGASGALLVFDLSRRQTFVHATDWLADLRQIAEPDIVIVLVGNKADLATSDDDAAGGSKREVTRAEAEEWARRNGVAEYVETSAKSGENVEMAFMRVAERIYRNIQAGMYDLNDRRSGVKGPSTGGDRNVSLRRSSQSSGCC